MAKLSAAQKELSLLEKELGQYGACDPAVVEDKKRAVILAKEAAIRWTGKKCYKTVEPQCASSRTDILTLFPDNYAMLLSYFTRQFGVDPEEIRKHLGVDENYEDIL